eukprot:3067773-Pleurochrysis_carterae.AAC.1
MVDSLIRPSRTFPSVSAGWNVFEHAEVAWDGSCVRDWVLVQLASARCEHRCISTESTLHQNHVRIASESRHQNCIRIAFNAFGRTPRVRVRTREAGETRKRG